MSLRRPGYQQRFRREAHTAARLNEPHIIPIHDTGEIDGQLYLVMPIVEGIDVEHLLQRDGPMSRNAPCTSSNSWPPPWTPRTPSDWCTATSNPPTRW